MGKMISQASRLGGAALALLLTCGLAAAPAAAQAAGATKVFDYVDIAATALDTEQASQLQAYRADPTAGEIKLVRLQAAALKAADAVTLNLPDGGSVLLDVIRVEERAPDDYSWFASQSVADETIDEAILVIKGTDIVGTVRSGGKLYRVRPLVGGNHVLIRVDQAKFPPDHPPDAYERLERQGSLLPEPNLRQGDAWDSCSQYTAIIAYTQLGGQYT